jgi:hypothetical protein
MERRDEEMLPITDEMRERSRAWFERIQDERGVDVSLILSNLRLTPDERLARLDAAREQALWIRRHARRIDA